MIFYVIIQHILNILKMNGSIRLNQYETSNKGTQSTMPMQFKSSNEKEKYSPLYKEDSGSSDQLVLNGEMKDQFRQLKKSTMREHDELRKFLKKADEINQINYKKLKNQIPSLPSQENSQKNLYKSNKNILQQIDKGKSRNRNVGQVYMQRKQNLRNNQTQKRQNNRNNSLKVKKKQILTTTEVQTQRQIKQPVHHSRYPTGFAKLNAIQQDQDEDYALERKKNKMSSKIFNTISLQNNIPRRRQKYQQKESQNEQRLQYPIKKQKFQRTMFNTPQMKIEKRQSDLKPIANNTYANFWGKDHEDQDLLQKQPIKPVTKKKNKKLSPVTKNKVVDNENSSRSLVVQEGKSKKNTQFTEYLFNKESQFDSTIQTNLKKEQIKEISIQFPEVSQLVIKDNNEYNEFKKPTHPIGIDFSSSDANWITQTFKPKSSFLKKIDHKNFQIKKYRNGVYFGELSEEGLKHGKGVIFYFNGRSYQGNFVHDAKEGKGFQSFPDGSKYTGDFSNGFKEGRGVFDWINGQVYDGEWKEGKKHGSGMWKSKNGDSYIGQWKKGKVQGFGVFVASSGDQYEGQFKGSKKHGLGTQRYTNGDTYVGLFAKNRPNGQGEIYYTNGDVYKGNFSNGLRHGEGVMKMEKENQVYKGQYRNDKKCGYGELSNQKGEVYIGNFENDLKHGYGQLHQNNKCNFKGYWLNNQRAQDKKSPKKSKSKQKGKGKIKGQRKIKIGKSPLFQNKQERVSSLENSVSPGNHHQRACGCQRKH